MRRSPRLSSMISRLFGRIPPGVVRRVALYGLALNAVWEFGHPGLFYGIWEEVGWADGLSRITLAILGDVVIMLAVMGLACCTVGASMWSRQTAGLGGPPRLRADSRRRAGVDCSSSRLVVLQRADAHRFSVGRDGSPVASRTGYFTARIERLSGHASGYSQIL